MRGKKIRLHDEGSPIRTWLHSADTAEAVITIIEYKKFNEIYNISGGFEQKNIDTTKQIVENYFGSLPDNYLDNLDLTFKRPGQDVRYSLCDKKLRSIGWKPLKKFDLEIGKIVDYYKNNFKW